ncbi:hypothetical protein CF336_g5041 [Tilletia laevis]|nr:hypothetical protein CF336_g5041 [Tilletia laevis]KAE8195052.1 hypothetical protein CF328_g4559 [Tilletia controversa]
MAAAATASSSSASYHHQDRRDFGHGSGSSRLLAQPQQQDAGSNTATDYIDLTNDSDEDELPARPGMLPIDDDNEDEDDEAMLDGFDGPPSSARTRHATVDAEMDDDGDEDPEDVLENALAGIGLVPLQTYLADWDSVMSSRAKAQAEKDLALKAAAAQTATGGKKSKKKKKNNQNGTTATGDSNGSTPQTPASASSKPAPRPDTSRIEADDADTSGGPNNKKKKRKLAKKATYTIDENAPASKTLNELAQWLGFNKPEFTFKFQEANRHLGTKELYQGRCLFNGQLFVSKSYFSKKANAKDDVAQDVIEDLQKFAMGNDGDGEDSEDSS